MKKIWILMIALIMCVLMATGVEAEEILKAGVRNGRLVINWEVECSGSAVLTVYENNWPIDMRYVNCDDGEAVIDLSHVGSAYSIRLKTEKGCLTAGVTVVGNTALPEVTREPEDTRTPGVTTAPTPVQTPEVTPIPTINATRTPAATIIATAAPTMNTGSNQTSLAQQVVNQVNAERAKYGLSQLRVDSELTRAACIRAAEIVEKFSHTRPDGSSWSTVSSAAYGENIAMGQKTADKVMAAWLTSEGHRKNILKSSYGSIGVCAYVYNGVTYWVQLFGK